MIRFDMFPLHLFIFNSPIFARNYVKTSFTVAGRVEEEERSSGEEEQVDDDDMKEKLADCMEQLEIAEDKLSDAKEQINGKVDNELNQNNNFNLSDELRRLRRIKGFVCKCKDDCPAHQQPKGGYY